MRRRRLEASAQSPMEISPITMVEEETFFRGHGKLPDCPGSESPASVPSQGTLTEEPDHDPEKWHVSFRTFSGSEESDPIQDLRRLRELCRLWLRPDLHTKEQIMDKLVLEQFMTCMPLGFQVLVRESGVESCRDLEDLLRENRKPKKWTVVHIRGKNFLVRDPEVQRAEAGVSDTDDERELFRKPQSPMNGVRPENGQQEEKALQPETTPESADLEGLTPKRNVEEDMLEDRKEAGALQAQPELQEGPDSGTAQGGKDAQEGMDLQVGILLNSESIAEEDGGNPFPKVSMRRRRLEASAQSPMEISPITMVEEETFFRGHGKLPDCPGSESPASVPSQGTLTEEPDHDPEKWHVSFRTFSGSEESDPIQDLRRLRELCRLWLRPDLHTKEQIMDKLVLEQFMTCMPLGFQVLVRESGVESCRDLEDLLRENRKPKKWTVVHIRGKNFLVRDPEVQMAEAGVSDTDDERELFRKPQSPMNGVRPENGQQEEKALQPETTPESADLEGLTPKRNVEEDMLEDRKEAGALQAQPELQEGPGE
ncbi:putative zinc finger and SCAN domain-containing protein 5C [Camelus dromedarius]|uniref:Putative zinc finger and SCAN domain-containing protein 5C n=1 Tax=Camelus dromedarius TaxID=9838 RepID=A0A5N4DPU1_CAMDR|nr:putative zinc finger and SCAN domain-containing protein 5C [Camelus dromedarius]